MATLTINGQKVQVNDSFMQLSPAEQERTVNEIASHIGQASGPPTGAVPGSRAYADWAAVQARAGKKLPQVSPMPPAAPPNGGLTPLSASFAATNQGLTGSIPFLNQASDALLAGGQTALGAVTGQPADFGANYNAIQQRRQQISSAAPIANTLGSIGGTMALTGGLSALPGGAEALGMAGGVGKQLVNSALSTAGYEGLQGLAHGHMGGQLLADEGIGAGSGFIGSAIGQGINKLGQTVADKLTGAAQNRLTTAAIKNAPAAADLFDAGSQLFEQATGNPLQVTNQAFSKLLGNVEQATATYRPNKLLNPEAVGLLRQLQAVSEEINSGTGVIADFKTLHILRQSAQSVTQSNASKSTKDIANIIVGQIDDFVRGLKPGDIAGATDPKAAANALMTGISTWHKASKVAMIEEAIKSADTYKSGTEMGLKASFSRLMKTPEYTKGIFSPAEKQAIRDVAKGTTMQNAMALLGRSGFSLGGGGGHNIIGGTLGAMTGTAALSPFLGPLAPVASLGISMGGSAVGRSAADKIATTGANRAAQIMATSGIPVARQLPNLLAPIAGPVGLLTRSALPLLAGARR